jgi:hypothetical protein
VAGSVTIEFEQPTGRLVLRCDTEMFERLREAVCREAGVFVPISVPPTPVREVAVVLAADAPPPRVSWARHLAAVVLCLLILAGPFGLYAIVSWLLE